MATATAPLLDTTFNAIEDAHQEVVKAIWLADVLEPCVVTNLGEDQLAQLQHHLDMIHYDLDRAIGYCPAEVAQQASQR